MKYPDDYINKIHCADCLASMKEMPDDCVDLVVTSPPYWGLRDYGFDGQLGLEPTFQEYITKLCNIFDEVKRVLKKTGTCFVNMGDTYTSDGKKQMSAKKGSGIQAHQRAKNEDLKRATASRCARYYKNVGLVQKSLLQIPSRFAIEMTNRGWILRNEIIWYKKNCMPASVKDRFTVDFEKLFFFSKNRRYYFEQQFERYLEPLDRWGGSHKRSAINEKTDETGMANSNSLARSGRNMRPNDDGRNKRTVWQINTKPFNEWSETSRLVNVELDAVSYGMKHIVFPNCRVHEDRFDLISKKFYDEHEDDVLSHIKHIYNYLVSKPLNDFYPFVKNLVNCFFQHNLDYSFPSYFVSAIHRNNEIRKTALVPLTNLSYNSFSEIFDRIENRQAKFLLFLLYLCTHESKTLPDEMDVHLLDQIPFCTIDKSSLPIPPNCLCKYYNKITQKSSHFAVFPEELCITPIKAGCPENGIVLDPFFGSGTTGLVARKLNRNYIGIELNKEYIKIAEERIKQYEKQLRLF